jgi:cobalt-zinc-cadmium efflux system outer membrane protein
MGALLALAVLLLPPGAAAQGVLSEADVVRMARSRSPAAIVASARSALAEAQARSAGLLPDPSLGFTREAVETGPLGSETVVSASVPVDIARPLARRSLAAAEGAWGQAEASLARTDAVLDALLTYYEVVLAEQRVQVLTQSVANLDEAARILARREAEGTASGYESTRLSVAGELGRSHLAEARGALDSARVRLAALLGLRAESLQVAGALSLLSAHEEAALARRGGAGREAVRKARDARRLATQAAARARWSWLPALELSGGLKQVSELDRSGRGYVLEVALRLPIFDRGHALRAEAGAMAALSTARAEALQRSTEAEVQGALATYRAARQELERFDRTTSGQVEALLAAAQSGYREGARSIVELVDAQAARTDVAERRLALLGMAKRAEARLRAAAGEL